MKPKIPEKHFSNCDDAMARSTFPITDYHYHSVTLPNFRGGCARPKLHSFRNDRNLKLEQTRRLCDRPDSRR